jgi:hypothetical protein
MSGKIIFFIFLTISCSMIEKQSSPYIPKEFSKGEVILATQLLSKIYDQEMAPLKCVKDLDEASLFTRTLNPRMEIVQDDLEAMLDNKEQLKELINECDKNCTCSFVDELLREHLVVLSKELRNALSVKNKQKDLNACLNFVQETFCKSELYLELNREKVDFTFDQ